MWDPTELRRMKAGIAALELTYTYNGTEKVYEFSNPGLEVFRKSDLDLILDGEQKVRFLSLADAILNKMNIIRGSGQPGLDIGDCLWVRHLGVELN